MHERMQTSRKGRVFAGGGLLVVCLLILGPAKAFGQTAPPGEAPPAPQPPRRESAGQPRRRPAPRHRRLRNQPPRPPPPPPPPVPLRRRLPFGTVPKGPVPPVPTARDAEHRLRRAHPFGRSFQGVSDPNEIQRRRGDPLRGSVRGRPDQQDVAVAAARSRRANTGATAGAPSTVPMSVLDAIAGFTPMPEFQIYAGRLLVMADRYAPSGPWSLDEWFYPGFWPARRPPSRRRARPGATWASPAWGAPLGGHIKYYLGAYQLQDPALSPLVQRSRAGQPALARAGVVSSHDVLRRPGSRLHRHRRPDPEQRLGHGRAAAMAGMTPPPPLLDDYREFNADLIVEKRFGDLGALSLEGAYYNYQRDLPALEVVDGRRDCVQLADPDGDRQAAAVVPIPAGAGKAGHGDRRELRSDAGLRRATDLRVMNWFAHAVVNFRHTDVVYASTSAARTGRRAGARHGQHDRRGGAAMGSVTRRDVRRRRGRHAGAVRASAPAESGGREAEGRRCCFPARGCRR